MKKIMLFAFILFAGYASHAQSNTLNFINNTTYTVYVSGQWGANTTCSRSGSYSYAVPPGNSTIVVSSYGGSMLTDEFIHLRVYSYDPFSSSLCNPNPIYSINLSPCPSYSAPLTDVLDIYDTCPFPTLYNATVNWNNANSPNFVDITIN